MKKTARVRVARNSPRDIKIRKIDVLVDGKFVGGVTFGQALSLDIEPGEHEIKVTNQLKSVETRFSVSDGEVAEFELVGVVLKGIWTILWISGTVPYKVELQRV